MYGELRQCLASTAGLREQLEQEAAAARQEAAQAQEKARMAQVCYFVNSQENWALAVPGSTTGLREQLEQEAAAARQEAAQALEEARMAQVCYLVNSQEKWAWARVVSGFDSWVREHLEQEAAAARQEAAQAQEEARMAQVCYFVNSQEKWVWAVSGLDSWAAVTAGAGGSSCQVVGCAGSIADPDSQYFGQPDPLLRVAVRRPRVRISARQPSGETLYLSLQRWRNWSGTQRKLWMNVYEWICMNVWMYCKIMKKTNKEWLRATKIRIRLESRMRIHGRRKWRLTLGRGWSVD